MPWDLFCRVVDNFGDIGVCWRLASQLADRGQPVRLWTDDANALAWMAPDRQLSHPLVEVLAWSQAAHAAALPEPGEVVIEAFGCDPPPAFVERMAAMLQRSKRQPLWINLEYLSAESHVERSHRLPSPQSSGPAAGLLKYFFFPGFSEASGGLLREPGLMERQTGFDSSAWLAAQGVALRPGERALSLFCYPDSPINDLVDRLAGPEQPPTLLLATAGAASAALRDVLGVSMQRGGLRAIALPWLSQLDYDFLLWACTINFVRGEDSAVRAQWAGRPFVWQFYRQSDGAHGRKSAAFLRRFFDPAVALTAPRGMVDDVQGWFQAWNGYAPDRTDLPGRLPDLPAWQKHCNAWRDHLLAQTTQVDKLLRFVAEAR